MRNKKFKLALVVILALFTLSASPSIAKKLKRGSTDAHSSFSVAGVGGATGSSLNVNKLLKEKMCLTDSCKTLSKEMIGLVNLISANETKMYSAIDKIKEKEIKILRNEYYEKVEDFKKAKTNSQNNLEVLEKDLVETETKLIDLASKNSCYVNTFKTEINSDKKQLQDLMNKYKQEYEKSQTSDSSLDSQDKEDIDFSDLEKSSMFDVEPLETISLKQGDLLAWGIPSVPRIPVPKPKAKPETQAGATEVKDETYRALWNIESNSSKITDSQKDQFLTDLRSGK